MASLDHEDDDAVRLEPAESSLVSTDARGPVGFRWIRVARPFGDVEVPGGDDWHQRTSGGGKLELRSATLQTTIMLEQQIRVTAAQRKKFVDGLIVANERDAITYRALVVTFGAVGPFPAACVDGDFRTSIHFATRDYVVFAHETAAMLMVRGPMDRADVVRSIIDRVTASLVRTEPH